MISNYIVKYRRLCFAFTILLLLVSLMLLPRVNVNTDMTKYLPDDSKMRQGLEQMKTEFPVSAEMNGANVRVMCLSLSSKEKTEMCRQLEALTDVRSVTVRENGDRVLYELAVDPSVDQISMRKSIKKSFGKVEAVETAQDGTTAEASMLLGAVFLLFVILFIMCQSWVEPLLFLCSTGMAVLLNMGTNALLPGVSVTTNSIASVLQLVLSMDYSIILLNRYRQERPLAADCLAGMTNAVRKASASILSSGLTTIVGLLMLVLMKLKIGSDIGVVLAKGVLCSMFCNFTVLPTLILTFENAIRKTRKKVPVFPTDRLAGFSLRFRIPLAVLFVAVFAFSYILHNRTEISFLKAQESVIAPYFPQKNPVVLLYATDEESAVTALADSLMQDGGVARVLSYPSLLLHEYRAGEMLDAVEDMAEIAGDMGSEPMSLPAEAGLYAKDVLHMVYYAAHAGIPTSALRMQDLLDFVLEESGNSQSLISILAGEEWKSGLQLLEDFRSASPVQTLPKPGYAEDGTLKAESASPDVHVEVTLTEGAADAAESRDSNRAAEKEESVPYSPFTDTACLHRSLTASEMAAYLGMDAGQAQMVYRLAKKKDARMTPLAFVHFLTDDVFKRKLMASMVSDSQRKALYALQAKMDSAEAAPGRVPMEHLQKAAFPSEKEVSAKKNISETELVPEPSLPATEVLSAVPAMPAMDLNRRLTAVHLEELVESMGEHLPKGWASLLYLYYKSRTEYDESWTLSLRNLVDYVGDSLLADPRFASLAGEKGLSAFDSLRAGLDEGLGHLRSEHSSIAVFLTDYPQESAETYAFVERLQSLSDAILSKDHFLVGESVMLSEMKAGFGREVKVVTFFTILAIFLVVAFTFRSLLLAAILVITVMSGVFVNVIVSGVGGGSMLYLAYLIVQSILMGAAIDYGILYANYYCELRSQGDMASALKGAYRGSVHTVLTSGLILILVPAAMTFLVSDPSIADIVRSIAVGALVTVLLILFVLPGLLAACDSLIVFRRKK